MEKDFQKWHKLKSKIHNSITVPDFRERDVWWCSIGANVDVEEDGKHETFERPVLVVRKFNKEMVFGIPLTSRTKESIYHFSFSLHEQVSTAKLSQMRLWSAKRLVRRIGKVGEEQFHEIQKRIVGLFEKRNGPLSGASDA